MEQATNQFSKGLQMDTNPMVQGTDSLTDCLNGTLITMNGNEVILQNDMGNRRIDNAFLPPGYQPVGIKEYGGIIYVAAYNPITNKSQIGSFPSPEKKISVIDDENLGGTFDFDSFFITDNIEEIGGYYYLKNDSFLIPLTKDTSLRAGDKFTIYNEKTSGNNGLSSMKEDITNYDNISVSLQGAAEITTPFEIEESNVGIQLCPYNGELYQIVEGEPEEGDITIQDGSNDTYIRKIAISRKKAYSPKNRKYTIQAGILNSQNEFVDITKSLKRWKLDFNNKWSMQRYNSEYSDIYKFNDGYFIPDTFQNQQYEETYNDAQLIKERQKEAVNTYAYKLIGPLYLKISLNHIQNFNYNIYGYIEYRLDNVIDTNNEPSGNGIQEGGSISSFDEGSGGGTPSSERDDQNEDESSIGINNGQVTDLNGSVSPKDPNVPIDYSAELIPRNYGSKKAKLFVEGEITYNCPDGCNTQSSGNEDYITFETGEECFEKCSEELSKQYKSFDFYVNGSIVPPNNITVEKSTYDPKTNLYTVKVIKEYYIDYPNETNSPIINYFIGVSAANKNIDNNPIYIKGLSQEGTLDLSLLGSGKLLIKGWRFYNDVQKQNTSLTVSFDSYPKKGEKFENLRFEFTDITNTSNVKVWPQSGGLPIYNGRQTYNIPWDFGIEARKVYSVSIKYDIINQNGITNDQMIDEVQIYYDNESESYKSKLVHRWFLSTELFNEFYNEVDDFCNTDGITNEEAFKNKMKVNLIAKANATNLSKPSESYEGSLTSYSQSPINYKCIHKYNVNINSHPEIKIENEELYPASITVNNPNEGIQISTNDSYTIKQLGSEDYPNNSSSSFQNQISVSKGNEYSGVIDQWKADNVKLEINISPSENNLTGTIVYSDVYYAPEIVAVESVHNAFDKLSSILDEALPGENHHSAILITYYKQNHPQLMVARLEKWRPDDSVPTNGSSKEGYEELVKGDGHYKFSANSAKIYQAFNTSLYTPGQMFMFMFFNDNGGQEFSDINPNSINMNNDHNLSADTNAIVWWRTIEGEWAAFNELCSRNATTDNTLQTVNDTIKKFIKDHIAHDYIYCMYNDYFFSENSNRRIYTSDQNFIHTEEYNLKLVLQINYIPEESQQESKITLPTALGNLEFTNGVFKNTTDTVEFDIVSSDNFHNYIRETNKDSISNIDLYTGKTRDSQGNPLNPNYIYYYQGFDPEEASTNNYITFTVLEAYLNSGVNISTEASPINVHINYKLQVSWHGQDSDYVWHNYSTVYQDQNGITINGVQVIGENDNIPSQGDYIRVNSGHNITDLLARKLGFLDREDDTHTGNVYKVNYTSYTSDHSTLWGAITSNHSQDTDHEETKDSISVDDLNIVRIQNPVFITDFQNTINGKNTLAYNRYSLATPGGFLKYQYESNYNTHEIYYDLVNLITKEAT